MSSRTRRKAREGPCDIQEAAWTPSRARARGDPLYSAYLQHVLNRTEVRPSPACSGFGMTSEEDEKELWLVEWYSKNFPTQEVQLTMFLRKLVILITLHLSTALVFAEGTRTWEQSKYEDFQKGTAHGVAISSDGTLELAPAFKLVASTPASVVWATAVGPQGEIYAATGGPGRVYSSGGG